MEPNINIARQWWTEMPNKWTVVGWKDHILRFNVVHNGTIITSASWMDRMRKPPEDPNCMFSFRPSASPEGFMPLPEGVSPLIDDGSVVQGWNSSDTPVLWSEWQVDGQLLRQEVFAHVPGGQPLKRGDEPLFAWVRLSVSYSAEPMPVPARAGFGITINHPSLNVDMKKAWTLRWLPAGSKYRRELSPDSDAYDAAKGLCVLEPDGRVRIGIAPGQDCQAVFKKGAPSANDSLLHVNWAAKTGSYVDILVPMMPVDRATFDKEMALGRDAAFRETEAYWKKQSPTAATFDVPEDYVNQLVRRNLQSSEITSERDPETGDYTMLTGGMGYGVGTWATPTAITMGAMYHPLGHFDVVEKYLQGYKSTQGTVKPPGDYFELHPGYFSLPARVAVVHWLCDHGSTLWLISQHCLLSCNKAYADEWTPVILKGLDWIKYARAIEHPGVPGIMPPAGWSDDESRVQAIWSDAWIYKGLVTAVRFLKSVNHPRAAEFEQEAREYREAFLKAYRAKYAEMPAWSGPDGKERRLAPSFFSGMQDWQWRHVFYLDGGPMSLVWGELMSATDPIMRDAVYWFREGPPQRMARLELDYTHMPFLYHEASSWEICYSWNIFHSWELADRERFLEGMYALLTGGYSQQTFSVCEERGGMLAATNWIPAVLHLRNAVVDDQIRENELHLLRLCPLAWLSTKRQARFVNMPTYYGPVTLKASLKDGGKTLQVFFTSKFRRKPGRIVLHVPPLPGIETVLLNGKPVKWSSKTRFVVIEAGSK